MVEQLADVVPMMQILDILGPQMGYQLVASLLHLDTPIPEQVIEVPKISLSSRRSRKVLRVPQTAEQLVEVLTDVPFSSLQQQIAEQSIDIPVPRRRRGSGGGLQGQDSSQRTVEQIVDILGELQDSLLDPGSATSSGLLRDEAFQFFFVSHFSPSSKKCAVRQESECRSRRALELMDAGGKEDQEFLSSFESEEDPDIWVDECGRR